jgi:hypothetical protein
MGYEGGWWMQMIRDRAQERPLGTTKADVCNNFKLCLMKKIIKKGDGCYDLVWRPIADSGNSGVDPLFTQGPTRYSSSDNEYFRYNDGVLEQVYFPPSRICLAFNNYTVRTGPTLAPSWHDLLVQEGT